MSWGARALRYEQNRYRDEPEMVLSHLDATDPARSAFKAAFEQLTAKVRGIEAWLKEGSLCSRDTANAIKAATGITPYGYQWTPDEVKEIAAKADWSFAAPEGTEGNKQSAKAFFDVCVEQNLGMGFD